VSERLSTSNRETLIEKMEREHPREMAHARAEVRLTAALVKVIENAMQTFWNGWCADTGCIPTEFHIHGPRTTRVVADFRDGDMASRVAEAVAHHLLPQKLEDQ